MGSGFRESYLGRGAGVRQRGKVISHFSQPPRNISTLAYSLGCYTPICCHTLTEAGPPWMLKRARPVP